MALETAHRHPSQTATGRILVGTSGWSYRHWRGVFYPGRLAGNATLAYYAQRFATVEVDRTFFSLLGAGTIERWRDTAPAGFTFAVRAPREITHVKRLRRNGAALADSFSRMRGLGAPLTDAYGRDGLQRWADACRSWAADEFDVRVSFTSHPGAAAVRDAVTVRDLLGQRVARALPDRARRPAA